jgi:hypothetical protein
MPVTFILKESDFRRLFDSVPLGSASYACLDDANQHGRIPGIQTMHDRVAVTCRLAIAQALLAVARVSSRSHCRYQSWYQGTRRAIARRATRRTPPRLTASAACTCRRPVIVARSASPDRLARPPVLGARQDLCLNGP